MCVHLDIAPHLHGASHVNSGRVNHFTLFTTGARCSARRTCGVFWATGARVSSLTLYTLFALSVHLVFTLHVNSTIVTAFEVYIAYSWRSAPQISIVH